MAGLLRSTLILGAVVMLAIFIGMQSRQDGPSVPCPPESTPAAPDSFAVALETTTGAVTLRLYRDWSPHGVDRVHCLVQHGHFDGLPVFRVVEGFVGQFGLTGDPVTDSLWAEAGIPDEPVRASNERGTIAFARDSVDTRSAQLFINLADNVRLDTTTYNGVTGFPPLGRVTSGMEAVDAWHSGYGEDISQDSIRVQGRAYLARNYPDLDVIEAARIVE
ncbi:MAG: peptidylprolyl isomerase [Bacteroidota bacterium]